MWECSPTSATYLVAVELSSGRPALLPVSVLRIGIGGCDLRVLEWLLEHFSGCEVPVWVVEKATEQGRMDILRLLVEHDAGRRGKEASSRAEHGENDEGNVAQWGGSSLVTAAQMKRFDIVRFLYENTPRDMYEESLDMTIPFVLDAGEMNLAQEVLPPGTSAADYGDISSNPSVVELAFDAGLLDEDFLDGPHYAEVTARRGGTVQVTILPRSDDEESTSATITRAVAAARSVPRSELSTGQPRVKLFLPVCYRVGDVFRHGQITAYNSTVYVVSTEGETHEVPFSAPTEIAPAVAVLLWNAALLEDVASMSDLEAAHALILDRLLGQNGKRATKAISRLLAGIATRQSMPRPSAMMPWVCPRTGHELLVSVVDVLNFAFYVDGGRAIPANVRVGATFLDGPATRPAQGSRRPRSERQVSVTANHEDPMPPATTRQERPRRTRRTISTAAVRAENPTVVDAPSSGEEESSNEGAAATQFADLLDALSSDHPAPKRRRTVRTEQAPPTPVGHVTTAQGDSRAEPATADPVQAILHALAPYPSVLAAYAQQLQRLSAPATSPSQVTGINPPPISQAVRLSTSPSDLIPVNEPSDRRQQNFRPSRAQQEVHDAISAPAYIGKDGDVYMDHVRTSTATRFLAHPAVASRLFDIEFSACDLSILHFPRFALDSPLNRSKAKAVNTRNFSSKVALPELPDKPIFFNEETRDVFAAAKDFGEQLEDFAPWSSSEVHILAFWFSNIIGAYRLAVVEDMRSGRAIRSVSDSRCKTPSWPDYCSRPHVHARTKRPGQMVHHLPGTAPERFTKEETTLWLGKELSVGTVRYLRKSRPKFQRKTDASSASGVGSRSVVSRVIELLEQRLQASEKTRKQSLFAAFEAADVEPPHGIPAANDTGPRPTFSLDHDMVRTISLLVTRTIMTLAETIRLWRGQSASSPTPNKALVHDHFPWLLHEYEHVNLFIRTATQDDHVLVEYETHDRLQACDSALRLAMTAVLGPRAINNKKFTEWSTNVVALGLEWDSVAMTVSMPVSKLQKALGRVEAVLVSSQTTRTALAKLLGSLRHVCSCIRPAKPFIQQLVALWKRSPRVRPISLTLEARLDLAWFAHILRFGRLRGVPLEYFCGLPAPAVHLYMDASDSGLCVLNPVRHEFIRLQFDPVEQDLIKQRRLSINVKVPDSMRKAYDGSCTPFNNAPLPIRPDDNTTRHGSNGSPSVGASDGLPGYHTRARSSRAVSPTGNPAVNFDDAVHAVITLRGSKTDQRGEGSARYLSRSGHGRPVDTI
ncbi:hypothetical protein PHYSODRAFT_307736 [Phytophthora sojae]|uniref:Uncharacterized protein n=1 Tax=Phytophthora sojae (strain P6497) TaxID=1094619 RepID=G5AFV9_PHYSP|nr:hypothetical protein PHYSODRAFT_307736 [Phytophthora sojae]EGZ05475.1 hypothetical protein PHYSODRAFT_307736 [Phytophthora sojae]|eukprot:XP_009539006.1 hypothetical protein PHYSODRAFT_307736 [Phytophthora sojae]